MENSFWNGTVQHRPNGSDVVSSRPASQRVGRRRIQALRASEGGCATNHPKPDGPRIGAHRATENGIMPSESSPSGIDFTDQWST